MRRRGRGYEAASEIVHSLLARYGSSDRALEELAKDNYELREERREGEEKIAALEVKIPPDGALVLTDKNDVASWNAVKAAADEMKLPADKLGEQLVARAKKASTLEAEKATSEKLTARKAVADTANLDGDALAPLLDQFGLDVELREIQIEKDGKLTPTKVAHVKKAGDANAGWEKLTDFVARDGSALKPFAAALAKKTTTQQSASAPFPDQSGGTPTTTGNSAIDKFMEKRKEQSNRPNPFSKPTVEKKVG